MPMACSSRASRRTVLWFVLCWVAAYSAFWVVRSVLVQSGTSPKVVVAPAHDDLNVLGTRSGTRLGEALSHFRPNNRSGESMHKKAAEQMKAELAQARQSIRELTKVIARQKEGSGGLTGLAPTPEHRADAAALQAKYDRAQKEIQTLAAKLRVASSSSASVHDSHWRRAPSHKKPPIGIIAVADDT